MHDSLFFIPLIEKALARSDTEKALIDAFRKIRAFGENPVYANGFVMFSTFMQAVAENWDFQTRLSSSADAIKSIALQKFADTFLRTPIGKETETDRTVWPPDFIEIEVFKDGQKIGYISAPERTASIDSVFPGMYSIRSSTGWVLWEDDLTRQDVIWTVAYPEKDFAMAADTEAIEPQPTRTISVLGGEIDVFVYAGIESGKLEIQYGKAS